MVWRKLGPLLLSYCVAVFPAAAALRLELDPAGLTAAQYQASQQLLDEVSQRLPPLMRQRLDRRVVVQWRSTSSTSRIGHVSRGDRIGLNRHYLPGLEADIPLPDRRHGSVRQELLATLLHELAHLYDRGRFWLPDEERNIQRCSRLAQRRDRTDLPPQCLGQADRRFTFSDAPRLLDLAGWMPKARQPHQREQVNGFILRSPDRYELASPREFVAVNLEYFLLDPQYACRRPALHRYFREHFQWAPFNEACPSSYVYLNAGRDFVASPLAELDPARVYQIDYLLAEANDQIASQWGHSMLRLVVCAPGRPPSDQCRLDLDHHLVLSYRAFVEDVQLSSWDGLTGVYPSRLFVLPLAQIIEEYTKLELRALSSIPLTLSPEEIAQLIEQTAQSHWAYDGQYYFISNNCAVETLNLLRRALPSRRLDALSNITPTGLLRALDARGMTDMTVLHNERDALRLGYRFDSFRQRYQAMFDVLRQQLAMPHQRVEEWFASAASERRQWIEKGSLQAGAAMLLLEQAILRRQLQLAQDELKQMYFASDNDNRSLEIAGKTLRQLLSESGFLSRPGELLKTGYGLPQTDERIALQQDTEHRQQRLLKMSDDLQRDILQLLTAQRRQALQDTEDNLQRLSAHLQQLHEAQKGLRLP